MRWLLAAITQATGEVETRRFLKLRFLALVMTLGAIVALGLSLGALLALPAVLDHLGLAGAARLVVNVVRFPALAWLILTALAILYHYGPDHPSGDRGGMQWLSWGSGVAAVVWLAGSTGLSLYVANASKFQAAGTYGALGGVVVLLLWLWMSSFAVILGAVVNRQIARR